MEIPCHQVDAFARRAFEGNPAAVCPLSSFLDDAMMQAIAAENALSETAFFVKRGDGDYDLRWFTPAHEVDLCGHATLATAYVLRHVIADRRELLRFHTKSGVLTVRATDDALTLDFPSRPPVPASAPEGLLEALGLTADEQREVEVLRSRDLVIVLSSSDRVRALVPDLGRIARFDSLFAVSVTARGGGRDTDVDFVSRFFAPREGVPEDPVTGSAHCTLAPLWAARLGKTVLRARQVSKRGGEILCTLEGDRVLLEGHAVLVKTGTFFVPTP
ncbi:MAG: PhzF family phenazine biosynthesis protein [Deltaproteobacteria bacterium]|nr:PhzF family phenazine biosynthesis protein [Deltaproteobacteria bacterium]